MENKRIMNVCEKKETENRIKSLIREYYKDYYLYSLGLPDFESRIEYRLNEVENASYTINRIEQWINYKFDETKKILVVGAGTGAEFVQFFRRGCDVYAVEPNNEALEIIYLRSKLENISFEKTKKGLAENLPFKDNSFDFVWCWTVIEHVKNVEKTVTEMLRVVKNTGFIFIGTLDYRQIWEGHYKLYLPLFMPKWFIKIVLKIKKRPTSFIDTLQFVTAKQLRNIFRKNNVIAMQIIHPYNEEYLRAKGNVKIVKWMQNNLEIARDQYWIIKKR
jgi:ubiquinone/menaquinone biosynthesis C-methylase UbiE